jgi:endonuclease/exonuclease/phosphatase family metal-dependent hydrolase
MPNSFPKPKTTYTYDLAMELKNLAKHKAARKIPARSANKLLLATWNIANLGGQERREKDYTLIAEILSWFDIIGVQECKDNLSGLRQLKAQLPENYKVIFSNSAGNDERMTYIWDSKKVSQLEKVGELFIPLSDYPFIKLPNVKTKFAGYDRCPFIATFKAKNFDFVLVNSHTYFGNSKTKESVTTSMERRALETFCVARWAELRRKSKHAFSKNIIAVGDFNIPKAEKGDPIYDALTAKGMLLPEHSTKVFSNIKNDADYDQVAFLPGLKDRIRDNGVFDFDTALFPALYKKNQKLFAEYCKYYISDHRPKWVQITL